MDIEVKRAPPRRHANGRARPSRGFYTRRPYAIDRATKRSAAGCEPVHVKASSRSQHGASARARSLPCLCAMTTTLTPYGTPRSSRPTLSLVLASPLHPIDRERRVRRFVNIVVAAVGLALTSPVLLLIAVLIQLTSRRPVLYTPARIGLHRTGLPGARG